MVFNEIVCGLLLIATIIYLYFKRKHGYWSRRNVISFPTTIPFGNLQGVKNKVHSSQWMVNFYNQVKKIDSYCGLYFFASPVLLAVDLAFVKNILIKDFSSFQERGVFYNEKDDPLSAHLFSVDGARWKGLRSKMTPTFTSGRMKFMFPTIIGVAGEFEKVISSSITDNDDLEIKELLSRYTTDVIGTCAFGIDCNSLKDPNAQFRAMGKKVFGKPRNTGVKSFLMLTFKDAARRLRMKSHHDDVTEFFLGIVRETIEHREQNNIQRNDFMDLLIEIKNRGSLDGTEVEKVTIEEIAAQAFVFFLAGFESSSTTLSFAIFELASNLEIQRKARDEVRSVLEKHGGQLTYEAMMEMHYVDHIINESLRKYPPLTTLIRMATRPYKVPDSNLTIDKNTLVMIPVYAIQHDPDIYEDPETFKPERFEPAAVQARPNCSFLSFGEGPRNCIGLRFGMMQARIGLITLLRHFEFQLSEKTKVPLEFKTTTVLSVKDGLYIKFKKI